MTPPLADLVADLVVLFNYQVSFRVDRPFAEIRARPRPAELFTLGVPTPPGWHAQRNGAKPS